MELDALNKKYFELNVKLKKLLEKYANLVNAVNFLKEELEDLSQVINEMGTALQSFQKTKEVKDTPKKEVKKHD